MSTIADVIAYLKRNHQDDLAEVVIREIRNKPAINTPIYPMHPITIPSPHIPRPLNPTWTIGKSGAVASTAQSYVGAQASA